MDNGRLNPNGGRMIMKERPPLPGRQPDEKTGNKRKSRRRVILGLGIFLGLTLLMAGLGKLPGQAEFIDALLKSFWTPTVAYFIGYCLPWVEVALGALLIMDLFARIAAILCLPLTIGFIANNSWALSQGERFPECASCFGVWEEMLGTISPLQALSLDIVLFGLALIVIFYHPGGFLSFHPWFIKKKGDRIND